MPNGRVREGSVMSKPWLWLANAAELAILVVVLLVFLLLLLLLFALLSISPDLRHLYRWLLWCLLSLLIGGGCSHSGCVGCGEVLFRYGCRCVWGNAKDSGTDFLAKRGCNLAKLCKIVGGPHYVTALLCLVRQPLRGEVGPAVPDIPRNTRDPHFLVGSSKPRNSACCELSFLNR